MFHLSGKENQTCPGGQIDKFAVGTPGSWEWVRASHMI